ncbi:hypothetical protein [Streptomyces sp. RKAG293]|uniref:hypothetical protein n=1 Tax=Streptomyces sp. RKAG293 TaxID=2893403 RepID=UPI00203329B8|nr:hypothetical protein [Streptomyces sp. RKAG293]MCM2416693.1 hypothetical protein [Streptomyces sp. RKAG293]
MEPVAAAAAALRPEQISAFIEAVLVVWDGPSEEEPPMVGFGLDLPVDKARAFGFVTAEEQREARAAARASTLAAMEAVIQAFEDDDPDDEDRLRVLREQHERGDARAFGRLAQQYDRGIGAKFVVSRAVWRWPGHTVAATVLAGQDQPDFVQFLATWAFRTTSLSLEQSMQAAWHEAFDRYGRRL